jgi:hypothetical protein
MGHKKKNNIKITEHVGLHQWFRILISRLDFVVHSLQNTETHEKNLTPIDRNKFKFAVVNLTSENTQRTKTFKPSVCNLPAVSIYTDVP